MKPEWREFLIDAGAEFVDGRVATFGNPSREHEMATAGNVLCDLSHLGLMAAHGQDAREFLHNQLTQDVNHLEPTTSRLAAYCSPKGRMLAVFRLFEREEVFYLRLPREVLESTLKRLRMFVLRSQVTLEDADDALVRFGFSGPQAEEELKTALGQVPDSVNTAVELDNLSVIRVPGILPRFEIYGELDAMKDLWDELNVRAAPVGADSWELLETLAGLPNVFAPTQEAFVPQMANLDLVEGVSFKKGCYPGQEVVARMHYLGKPNRRMFLALAEDGEAPSPGEKLFVQDQPAGEVVNAAPYPGGQIAVLAVLKLKSLGGDPVHLGAADGPELEFQPMPYEVPEAEG